MYVHYSVYGGLVYNAENLLKVHVFEGGTIMKKELINSGIKIISTSSISLPISKNVYQFPDSHTNFQELIVNC